MDQPFLVALFVLADMIQLVRAAMSWDHLATRLTKVPLVLAGPILREVTPHRVTVWVALQRACEVTLSVYAGMAPVARKLVETPPQRTVKIGLHLHVLALTAQLTTEHLAPGVVYLYDLSFLDRGVAIVGLSEAFLPPPEDPGQPPPSTSPLAYAPLTLPSFVLPPADPNKLRLIHGSCRKPDSEGQDALAILDDLIAATAGTADGRPHQLVLTGDQIYADDVADALLLMVSDAADVLLGWTETLPPIPPNVPPTKAADLPPYSREVVLRAAGFTSEDLRSHALTLGEYLALYLFSWSDALWPTAATTSAGSDTLPTFLDVVGSVARQGGKDQLLDKINARKTVIAGQRAHLYMFRDDLPKVRKALANIPTYMICDDHDVTDDWNMTREFCEDVYGKAFGVRVIQNALVAFAICQAWGNQPAQFDASIRIPTPPFKPAGARLLELLGTYEQSADEIRRLVGVHTHAELARQTGDYRVFHDGASLRYDFKIDGPGHVIVVSDTRTWRSFPGSSRKRHPDMLGPGELANQLTIPPTAKPKLVVFTTNAPPIRAIRAITAHPSIAGVYKPDLYDSWNFPSLAFDRMVVQLSKMCPVQAGTITGQVVLLSGDYHYSFASRLDYWATSRLGEAPQPAKLVIAQLVASPLRNESQSTRGHQDHGYSYHRHWYEGIVMPDNAPEGYAGYNWTSSASRAVGARHKAGHVDRLEIDGEHPTLGYELGDTHGDIITLSGSPPDYRYRLEYLNAAAAAGALHDASGAPPEIVGINNLGEINFQWDLNGGHDRRLLHTLRGRDASGTVVWARYDISLNIDDPKYPPIKARGGEP
jgi:hypothetical protein